MPVPIESTLIKQRYKTDNKFSEDCIDRLLVSAGKTLEAKQDPVTIFRNSKLVDEHCGQADLLSHANFPKG